MQNNLTFGMLLKRLRRSARMSQEELAAAAGYSASYISQLERGEKPPSRGAVPLLIVALQLSEEDAARLDASVDASSPALRFPAPPLPLTPLLGRETLLEDIVRMQQDGATRLMTLTGVAGVGKTRLALEVAQRLHAQQYPVLYLPLADISESSLVMPTLMHRLQAASESTIDSVEQLVAFLQPHLIVCVFDNFEHLLDAAPEVSDLLAACPLLHVVTTSRAPLRIRGEQAFEVPPLTLPADGDIPLQAVGDYSALAFLQMCARQRNHDFTFTAATLPSWIAILHALDGLPLGIELAVARLSIASPNEILADLHSARSLQSLAGGPRDLPIRQQTMDRTLQWSYDLLNGSAQRVLRAASICLGGANVGLLQRLLADGPSDAMMDDLLTLVENHLVVPIKGVETTRYNLLHTVRHFGAARAQAADEATHLRDRHAAYFVEWCETLAPALLAEESPIIYARIEEELNGLWAALQWLQMSEQWEAGLRLATALGRFWDIRSYWREGYRWLTTFLAKSAMVSVTRIWALRWASQLAFRRGEVDEARAFAEEALSMTDLAPDAHRHILNLLANIASMRGDYQQAQRYDEQSVALCRQAGDPPILAIALSNLGIDYMELGAYSQAIACYQESLQVSQTPSNTAATLTNLATAFSRIGDYTQALACGEKALRTAREIASPVWIAASLDNLGDIALRMGNTRDAQAYFVESLAIHQRSGDQRSIALASLNLGEALLAAHDETLALPLLSEARERFEDLGDDYHLAHVLRSLGDADSTKDSAQAMAYFLQSIALAYEIHATEHVIEGAESLAALISQQQPERATRLLGWADAARRASSLPVPPVSMAKHDAIVAQLRRMLRERFTAQWEAGNQLADVTGILAEVAGS